jgi:hypothetical protein
MEMKVKNDKFYLLEASIFEHALSNAKWIYDTESDAVKGFKRLISEKALDPQNIVIMEVDTTKEKWEINSVPWAKIAVQLVKGEQPTDNT